MILSIQQRMLFQLTHEHMRTPDTSEGRYSEARLKEIHTRCTLLHTSVALVGSSIAR